MKIYFAGSIRGGRVDANLYHDIIEYLKTNHNVLTEHVGNLNVKEFEKDNSEKEIYDRDMAWLNQADIVIAECSCPSIGVGYELAYAEKINVPCHVFYNKATNLSAMIAGNDYFKTYTYEKKEDIFQKLDEIL